jgi:hypothetical protein
MKEDAAALKVGVEIRIFIAGYHLASRTLLLALALTNPLKYHVMVDVDVN